MKRLLILVLALCVQTATARADATTDFFEAKIRPLLVEHCYECHGAASGEIKGSLQLDTRAGVLKGGDSGAVIVAGKPEASLLIKAVKWGDKLFRMPPDAKLSDAQIADLEKWIRDGAHDPRDGEAAKTPIEALLEQSSTHWSLQPIRRTAAPSGGEAHAVDAFLAVELKKAGLDFSPEADRRTLVRRAYFDLLGLPPMFAEVEEFAADDSPQAFERLIDKLLADPRYGERWGRHWLDVARYADNMGSIYNGDDTYPYGYTYRDYVIKAFNDDKPYDRFLLEQIAADRLDTAKDPSTLAAMGFLGIGRRKDRRLDDDTLDDTIDVIGRGLLGLTIGCARCHDHKLEPITTKDYYGLYAILKSSKEPEVLPPLPQAKNPLTDEFVAKNRQARIDYGAASITAASNATAAARSRVGDYLRTAHEADWKTHYEHKPIMDVINRLKLNGDLHNAMARARKTWIEKHPEVFGPYLEFATKTKLAAGVKLNPLVERAFEKSPTTIEEFAERYNQLFAAVDGDWRKQFATEITAPIELKLEEVDLPIAKLQPLLIARLDAIEANRVLSDPDIESLRRLMVEKDSPVKIAPERFAVARIFLDADKPSLDKAAKSVMDLEKHPGAPARAMVFVDAEKMYDGKVFVRGNPRILGPDAPRKFLTALEQVAPEPFPKDHSGRLELARSITSPKNPLTSRVIVNRVWQWHFGEGLVRTPSDFGFRGDKPTHPELLDHLALWFVENGSSFKRLHKYLMLSRAYRQSSGSSAASPVASHDPESKLLGRFPLRPLEFEAYRDTVLAVTGRLKADVGGKAVPITGTEPAGLRRTVYGFVDRKFLPSLYRNFDFPDPSFSAPKRSRSVLTPRALILLNSPWIVDGAKSLAADLLKSHSEDPTRVAELYRRVLQRSPTEREVERALAYLADYPADDLVRPEIRDWQYGYGTFDDKAGKVTEFASLGGFDGKQWKGKPKSGDGKSGDVTLDAQGGDPGPSDRLSSIRRWTAPLEGSVNITAELSHADDKSDGVSARIVSSRVGLLGSWDARRNAVATELTNVAVKKGEVLDFLVAGIGSKDVSAYRWAPTITMPTSEMPGMRGMPRRWDARLDFADPSKPLKPLTAWEELVQILLISPETAMME
jgi:hypothetical protein